MSTIYQQGFPRYYVNDGNVFEYGTGRLAFYIKGNNVHACDGTPVYQIDDGKPACYLHPCDGTPPCLYLCEDV